ncbi:putative transposase [Singulisphaera sp. GP187]|nr:putative transposase [Singulisphaera sp. GP187]
MRVHCFCVMPDHWHLVLWPEHDGDLSEYLRWLTVTHTPRWHAAHHTSGTGPLYQGRFKSFPVPDDEHLLTVSRYVERNALRANLTSRAEDWRWGSLWQRRQQVPSVTLADTWPVPRPRQWTAFVNQPGTEAELQALRRSVVRGTPFGEARWQQDTAKTLSLGSTLRGRGRPRKSPG